MHGNPILEWLTGYRVLTTISVACKLGLFTLLAERPQSAHELAKQTSANPSKLKTLLDACVGVSLLLYDRERYSNSSLAEVFQMNEQIEPKDISLEKWNTLADRFSNAELIAKEILQKTTDDVHISRLNRLMGELRHMNNWANSMSKA